MAVSPFQSPRVHSDFGGPVRADRPHSSVFFGFLNVELPCQHHDPARQRRALECSESARRRRYRMVDMLPIQFKRMIDRRFGLTDNRGEDLFPVFTHMIANTQGYFTVKPTTVGECMLARLEQIQQQLRARMLDPVAQTGECIQSGEQGCFNYHAVSGNLDSLGVFRFTWFGRRSEPRRRCPGSGAF